MTNACRRSPHQISLSSGKNIFDRVPKTLCAKVFCHLFKQSISCTGTIKYTLFGVHFSTHIFLCIIILSMFVTFIVLVGIKVNVNETTRPRAFVFGV